MAELGRDMTADEFTLWQALHLEHPHILMPEIMPLSAPAPATERRLTSDPKEFLKLLRASR